MCTAQLSVSLPLNCENDTPALSPRVAESDLTDPESFGHPVPEKTILVIFGGVGGAARQSAGRARKKSEDRMMKAVLV